MLAGFVRLQIDCWRSEMRLVTSPPEEMLAHPRRSPNVDSAWTITPAPTSEPELERSS